MHYDLISTCHLPQHVQSAKRCIDVSTAPRVAIIGHGFLTQNCAKIGIERVIGSESQKLKADLRNVQCNFGVQA